MSEKEKVIEEGTDAVKFDLPLQKISFDAEVSGMFARVTCKQEYSNNNKKSVEAIYVFPLPEDASITGCEMVIGDKKIVAELKEKKQARQEYQDAVDAGHHGSLLEQKRDNIFTMSVGGIEPGEDVQIVTSYSQRVPWQDNGGRFSIPLVVAPRFIPGKPAEKRKTGGGWAEDTDKVPDASQITPVVAREGVGYTADVKVRLAPGFRCEISSPSHSSLVGIRRYVKNPIELLPTNLTPDRDFVLCYKTKAGKVEAGVHKGSFEGNEYVTISVVPAAAIETKPKDIVFCLDISGSMSGPKLEGLKVVAEKVARKLQKEVKGNRVAIIAFESNVHVMHPLSEITDDTIEAIQKLEDIGGTMAGRALDHCFQLLSGESARERYILLVSDGQTEDRWRSVVKGVRVVAVGIGTAVNATYLKDIARETRGTSVAVYPGEDYDTVASTLTGRLSGPVMTDIEVLPDASKKPMEEVLGAADVYESMPATLVVKLDKLPGLLRLRGKSPQGEAIYLPVNLSEATECTFAHQIWAREKLRDKELDASVLRDLSLQYGVLCSETAYVAVHLKDVPGEKPQRIEIPVSLPYTWDYEKIFGRDTPISGITHLASPRKMRSSGPSGQSVLSSAFLSVGDVSDSASSDSASSASPTVYNAFPVRPMPSKSYLHVVEELEELAKSLEERQKRSLAEAQWQLISARLTVAAVKSWTSVQKAKGYYLLLKLLTYGFEIGVDLLDSLSSEPATSDIVAYEWWVKAQQELGVKVTE